MQNYLINDVIKAQQKKTCPDQHELVKTYTVSFGRAAKIAKEYNGIDNACLECDICRKVVYYPKSDKFSKVEFYSCEKCDFDACKNCYESYK